MGIEFRKGIAVSINNLIEKKKVEVTRQPIRDYHSPKEIKDQEYNSRVKFPIYNRRGSNS
jgi:hypothetical protein